MKSESQLGDTADVLPTGAEWLKAISDEPDGRHEHPAAILHRYLRVSNKLQLAFVSHFEKNYAISLSEFRVLVVLHNMGEAASHEIADVTGITTMSVSRAVASLTRDKRVSMRVDKANRRRKLLKLTAEGRRLVTQMQPAIQVINDIVIGDMSERARKQFSRVLGEMSQRLDALMADPDALPPPPRRRRSRAAK
ncbi:MAG: MarR family winged helix-turn-helix transcriptional regulator [Spongiibacteraceae bacterium]|nr:MarR family winged helix-turn-helix transcriptional regulator [Spongiibacteraceae bacterium]